MPDPKRRGRPPLSDDGSTVQINVRVPQRQFEAARKLAERHDVSISRVVRLGLRRVVESDESDEDE